MQIILTQEYWRYFKKKGAAQWKKNLFLDTLTFSDTPWNSRGRRPRDSNTRRVQKTIFRRNKRKVSLRRGSELQKAGKTVIMYISCESKWKKAGESE